MKKNSGGELPKPKERHIVSWSAEEDDILREQIRLHGTENWVVIASKFKDKSTRQCRRRWFTYLNSDFKKGGWSPEEDMLLCEAQKIFGNRWTEIAKVVSGRTDNAVKNRFATLCKKRAKCEASAKENSSSSFINLNNKRVIFPSGLGTDGESETAPPLKRMRIYISDTTVNQQEQVAGRNSASDNLIKLTVQGVPQNQCSSKANVCAQMQSKEKTLDAENGNAQGMFLKKDDPKVIALMQQAELLSSLAIKVNSEKTDKSFESAWMALEDFLKQNKEKELQACRNSDDDYEFVEHLHSCNDGSKPDIYDSSPASSEYSTGSTQPTNILSDKTEEECPGEICVLYQDDVQGFKSDHSDNQHFLTEGEEDICLVATNSDEADVKYDDEAAYEYPNRGFDSPIHVTPLFRSLAATIPSPKFSESEKHFLMKTLGMESTSPTPITNPSQHPTCKRSLQHCL